MQGKSVRNPTSSQRGQENRIDISNGGKEGMKERMEENIRQDVI